MIMPQCENQGIYVLYLVEDNGVPQCANTADLYLDLVTMLQKGRRLHE